MNRPQPISQSYYTTVPCVTQHFTLCVNPGVVTLSIKSSFIYPSVYLSMPNNISILLLVAIFVVLTGATGSSSGLIKYDNKSPLRYGHKLIKFNNLPDKCGSYSATGKYSAYGTDTIKDVILSSIKTFGEATHGYHFEVKGEKKQELSYMKKLCDIKGEVITFDCTLISREAKLSLNVIYNDQDKKEFVIRVKLDSIVKREGYFWKVMFAGLDKDCKFYCFDFEAKTWKQIPEKDIKDERILNYINRDIFVRKGPYLDVPSMKKHIYFTQEDTSRPDYKLPVIESKDQPFSIDNYLGKFTSVDMASLKVEKNVFGMRIVSSKALYPAVYDPSLSPPHQRG